MYDKTGCKSDHYIKLIKYMVVYKNYFVQKFTVKIVDT